MLLQVKQVVTAMLAIATFATLAQPLVVFVYRLLLHLVQVLLPQEVIRRNTNMIKTTNGVTIIS